MPSTNVTIDARDLMRQVTMVIKLTHIQQLTWRLRLGTQLVRLAAWIVDCELEFSDEAELREKQHAHNAREMRRRILNRRGGLGLSQQALADRAGISRNYVSMIERGKAHNLSVKVVEQLAAALETTPACLMGYLIEQAEPE